jgi:transposase
MEPPLEVESPLVRVPLHPLEMRAITHYLTLEESTPKEIFARLSSVFVEGIPSVQTIGRWRNQFLEGKDTLEDAPRSGRPRDMSIREEVAELVEEDPTRSQIEIAARTGHSPHTVKQILIKELNLRKASIKYVPHILSELQKAERRTVAKFLLSFLRSRADRSLQFLWTQDESWLLLDTPASFKWKKQGEPRDEAEKLTIRS